MPGGPAAQREVRVPVVRPFRALRFAAGAVDLAAVVAPPYDVIGPALQADLLARDPHNVVRLDLPAEDPGDPPDERYRRAARTLAEWRSEGTLRADRRPAFYAYEQTYRVPGSGEMRTQHGFFGRLRLEPYGSDVRAHERTMPGPREDRYRLLRATGANTSPVVCLYEDATGASSARLAAIAETGPDVDVIDDAGGRHRLWAVPEDAVDGPLQGAVAALVERAGTGPLTIADGHHRYETALRYRDERRVGAPAIDDEPAWDYVLVLFLDAASEPLTILPTHRLVRGLGDSWLASVRPQLDDWFEVRGADSGAALAATFTGPSTGGAGRFGLWTRTGGAFLTARPAAFAEVTRGDEVAPGDEGVARLDVSRLGLVLESLCGLTPELIAAGDRVSYSHDAADAIARVDRGDDGVDATFLLEATPVADVLAVAAAGGVMPQKSTYFYPKALTGLVFNPHEW